MAIILNKDKSFDNFLNALNARIAGKEYDTARIFKALSEKKKKGKSEANMKYLTPHASTFSP